MFRYIIVTSFGNGIIVLVQEYVCTCVFVANARELYICYRSILRIDAIDDYIWSIINKTDRGCLALLIIYRSNLRAHSFWMDGCDGAGQRSRIYT